MTPALKTICAFPLSSLCLQDSSLRRNDLGRRHASRLSEQEAPRPAQILQISCWTIVVYWGWYVVKATLVEAFRDTISLVRDAFLRRSPGTCTCTSENAARKCMCCTAKPTSPRASSCSQSRLRFCLRALGGKTSVRKDVRCLPIQTRLCKHSGNESNNPNQKTKVATSYITIGLYITGNTGLT